MLTVLEYDSVIQIKLSREPATTSVSACFVDGLLVDTGLAYTAGELIEYLQTKKVKTAVNTHYHEDHIGGNYHLQQKFGVEILAPPSAVRKIGERPALYPYQEQVWGYPEPTIVRPLGNRVTTDLYSFDVIQTPGHCPDHICLFEPTQGWLFAGDLFHSTHPRVARPEEDQWEIIGSLQKVMKLRPHRMFTAPSGVVLEPARVLEETIRYMVSLGKQVMALTEKKLTPTQIRQEIFGEETFITAGTQGQFSSENLVLGFLKRRRVKNS